MSATERDRERASALLRDYFTLAATDHDPGAKLGAWRPRPGVREAIAAALAEERERERSIWNPMVGRVLAVAQEWHRQGERYHSRQIFDAIGRQP